jgi:hypothetical protein
MKTVTVEQFMGFAPCYGEGKIRRIAGDKDEWTALDVLALDNVPDVDRLWAVLRPEFIDEPILHEFACRCAERALEQVDEPDPRYLEAIAVKRRWIRGGASDAELAAALAAANDAWCAVGNVCWSVAEYAMRAAIWATARNANVARVAWEAAKSSWDANVARVARVAATSSAWNVAVYTEQRHQAHLLREMIMEGRKVG